MLWHFCSQVALYLFLCTASEAFMGFDFGWRNEKKPKEDLLNAESDLGRRVHPNPMRNEIFINRYPGFHFMPTPSVRSLIRTRPITEGTTPPYTLPVPTSTFKPEEEKIIEIDDTKWDQLNYANSLEDLEYLLGVNLTSENNAMFEENVYTMSMPGIGDEHVRDYKRLKSSLNPNYWTNPEPAGCQLEERTIDLELPKSKDIIYFPTCVRVKRCGGCCTNEVHECQHITLQDITIKVVKVSKITVDYNSRPVRSSSRRRGRNRRSSTAQVMSLNSTIAEHTDCKCQCILKESECDLAVQRYNDKMCTCDCLNSDDEGKCLDQSHKFWNKDTCKCECRRVELCTSGYEFHQDSCKCRPKRAHLLDAGEFELFRERLQ